MAGPIGDFVQVDVSIHGDPTNAPTGGGGGTDPDPGPAAGTVQVNGDQVQVNGVNVETN